MKCTNRPADLTDYAQGTASPAMAATIAEHVKNCPICTKEAAELSAIFASLKTRRLKAPPESYWANLVPRIHERIGEKSPANRFLRGAPVLLPAAGIMLLVIFMMRVDVPAPPYEAQDIPSILHEMAGETLQEVDQSIVSEEPAGTDKEILLAIFEDGEPTEEYTELDQVQPESAITDDEAVEVVERLEQHI